MQLFEILTEHFSSVSHLELWKLNMMSNTSETEEKTESREEVARNKNWKKVQVIFEEIIATIYKYNTVHVTMLYNNILIIWCHLW